MEKETKYILIKKNKYTKYSELVINNSYNMNKKKDGQSLGIIRIYDEKMINSSIKKNIDLRFKKLLDLIIRCEESDDDPSEGLLFCLDETDKFRHELINKYERFLKKEQKLFYDKKIDLIEKEIKNKLLEYRLIQNAMSKFLDEEPIFEEERTRSR